MKLSPYPDEVKPLSRGVRLGEFPVVRFPGTIELHRIAAVAVIATGRAVGKRVIAEGHRRVAS